MKDRKTSRLPPVYYCFCAFYKLTDRQDSYTTVGRYDVRQQAEVPGAGQHHSAASSELAASGASAAKEGKIERSQIFLEIWPRLKNRLYDAVVLRESSCLIQTTDLCLVGWIQPSTILILANRSLLDCFRNSDVPNQLTVQAPGALRRELQEDLKQIKKIKTESYSN